MPEIAKKTFDLDAEEWEKFSSHVGKYHGAKITYMDLCIETFNNAVESGADPDVLVSAMMGNELAVKLEVL